MNRRRSRVWRRLAAAAVAMLGLLDVVQAASRGPITKLGWLSLDLGGSTTRLFRYVLLIAALTLVSAARGLLRGKRTAWLLALGAAIASLFGHHLVTADLFGIVVAVGVVGLLLVLAPQFRARSDPALARQGIFWLLGGGAATYGYGVGGLYLLDAQFRRSTSLVESLEQATRLLFLLPTSTIDAVTTHGKWFIDSVRVLAIVVLLIGVARLLRPVSCGAPGASKIWARCGVCSKHMAIHHWRTFTSYPTSIISSPKTARRSLDTKWWGRSPSVSGDR